MSSSEPLQAFLSRDTDMSKTDDTRRVIEGMVAAINDHRIDDIGEFFSDDFVWRGNTGCGVKHGLQEFQDNWQRPFQAAFSGKRAIDEARLVMGEWAASFGAQHAEHTGTFMGVPATNKKGRNPLHGFLESRRRQDRRKLGQRRLPPRPSPARCRHIQWRGLGTLRQWREGRTATWVTW